MKKYSFVIPTYQSKKRLKNTLEALNNLEGGPSDGYEAIVVDDGSEDGSEDYVKNVNRNYELKYIYLQRNEGACRSRARNFGWRAAGGRRIIFIDSDVIVNKGHIKELDRCFANGDDIVAVGLRTMLWEDIEQGSIIDGSIYSKFDFDSRNLGCTEIRHFIFDKFSYNANCYRYPWLIGYTSNMAVSRELLDRTGGFDENFKGWGMEDIELSYRLHKAGAKIVINSRMDVLHQYHGSHHGIDESKFSDIERSTKYFLNKHPHAIEAPEGEIFNFFKAKGRAKIFLAARKERYKSQKTLSLRDKGRLDDLKKQIISLSNEKGLRLIINDYVEDTDLDLWLQLLGERNSIPRYYPVSKKLPPGEVAKCRPLLYR